MRTSETIGKLAEALAAAQAEMQNPGYDAANPHFRNKYASLAAVRNAVIPVLGKHGLALVQMPSLSEAGVAVVNVLLHTSGEWIEADPFTVPVTKDDAQGVVGASTYARRIGLQAFAVVAGEDDDDGNAAAAAAPTKADADGVVLLTEKQQKLVWARGKAAGLPAESLAGIVREVTGAIKVADIPADRLDAVLAAIAKAGVKGEPKAPDFTQEPPALTAAGSDDLPF